MKTKLITALLVITSFANAQYSSLLSFNSSTNGGCRPFGSLISDGSFLYGMTRQSGATGAGTIFKISLDGSGYVALMNFDGATNGGDPYGSLISDGTFLYGMTRQGGVNDFGTIFKIMPDGTGYVKLLEFDGATNGSNPYGSLISDGTFLYGMTRSGGTNNFGTIFKIKPDGTGYVKLLDFDGAINGRNPFGSLLSDGTFLYGMTSAGGANGVGTIFKIASNGTGYETLLDFNGAANGGFPKGSLISDGTFFYGMTEQGGTNGLGTIFKILTDGTGYAKLLDFAGAANGSSPKGSLIFDGTFLYGTTRLGGVDNIGTIFKIMPNGTGFAKLLDFDGTAKGSNPWGSLISDGTSLYGMTSDGGYYNEGKIFQYEYCVPITLSQSPTICAGQSLTVGLNTYTTAGTYTDILTSTTGCDSTVHTNLTVLPANTFSQSPSICSGQSITVGANTYTGNGTYTDVLTATNGCDSTVTTNLTVLPQNTFSQSPSICSGQSITVGANTYTGNGTYTDVLTATNGCDSTVTTNLTVLPQNTFSQSPTICAGQSVTVGANTYTVSGTYIDTLSAINACDSIVTTNLTVNPLPVLTTSVSALTITANQSGATYQWFDCTTATPIAGETNQSYTASSNGSYAVMITLNSCIDTSACVTILSTEISQYQNLSTQVFIYPNPFSNATTLKTNYVLKNATLIVYNTLGEQVKEINNINGQTITFNRETLEDGIYFIQMKENNKTLSLNKLVIANQ